MSKTRYQVSPTPDCASQNIKQQISIGICSPRLSAAAFLVSITSDVFQVPLLGHPQGISEGICGGQHRAFSHQISQDK
jgi:hypothetical protein